MKPVPELGLNSAYKHWQCLSISRHLPQVILSGELVCGIFCLTLKFLVAVMNTLDTKTRSSIETAEFSFENGEVKSICYCKKRMKTKLSLLSQCIRTKLCKPCTSLTWYLHSLCGMVWYRTLRAKWTPASCICILCKFSTRCSISSQLQCLP